MSTPTIQIPNLAAVDVYVYRATAKAGDVYAEMELVQDCLDCRPGSYLLRAHVSRTARAGRIGKRQIAEGTALLNQLREQFGAALAEAGFASAVDTYAGMTRTRWFRNV